MLKKLGSILAVSALSLSVSANVQAATVTVQKGDTLWDLSQENNLSVDNIKKLNDLTTDLIHPGDVLTVAPEKQYTVSKGDTLWDIARDHQVTVSQIKEWNQLHTDLIHPGLNLLVFEGVKATESAQKPVQSVKAAPKQNTAPAVEAPKETTAAVPTAKAPKQSTTTAPAAETQKENTSTAQAEAKVASVKEFTVEATAYTASCEGCSGITATGINLKENPNAKVISVDPSVIPLGSKVYVEGYGEAIAGDTGGAIKGKKIDVFIPNKQDAINFGRKQVKVTILD